MGRQGCKEAQDQPQVPRQDGRYRAYCPKGLCPHQRYHHREEGQEGVPIPAQGPALPLHEQGAVREEL